jgi:hypothetical protein
MIFWGKKRRIRFILFLVSGSYCPEYDEVPFSFLPEVYSHLRWDVCFVSYTTKGCCVEKFGLQERKLSTVFSILLIFGGLFKAWWTVNSQK